MKGVNIPWMDKCVELVGRGWLNFHSTQSKSETDTNFLVVTRQTKWIIFCQFPTASPPSARRKLLFLVVNIKLDYTCVHDDERRCPCTDSRKINCQKNRILWKHRSPNYYSPSVARHWPCSAHQGDKQTHHSPTLGIRCASRRRCTLLYPQFSFSLLNFPKTDNADNALVVSFIFFH